MKNFCIRHNVGKAKYVVSYHNGKDKHKDGSSFYHIEIFKNKIKLNEFINNLKKEEYEER